MHTDEYIRDAFTCGDCWVLALELKNLFPHLTVVTLIDPYWAGEDDCYDCMQWCHAMTYDNSTGTYYDVNGTQTFEDVQNNWDGHDWKEIYEIPDEDLGTYFSDQERYYPEVPVSEGVRLATLDTDPLAAVA